MVIHSGKQSEIFGVSGAVLRLDTMHSVEDPINRFKHSSLLPLELRARGKIDF